MDDHSFVDLPDGMPKDIFQHLRKVWVNQRQLQISLPDNKPESSDKPARPTRQKPGRTKKRPAIAAKSAKKRQARNKSNQA